MTEDDRELFAGVPIYERWNGRGLRYWIVSAADWFDDEVLGHRFHLLCKIIEACPWWELGNNVGFPPNSE